MHFSETVFKEYSLVHKLRVNLTLKMSTSFQILNGIQKRAYGWNKNWCASYYYFDIFLFLIFRLSLLIVQFYISSLLK